MFFRYARIEGYMHTDHRSLPSRPHDGRGISVQDMAEAAYAALNFNQTNLALVAQGAFALLGSPDVIDLEDLNTPNATEHTASLTREDHASGDSLHFSAARLEALLADSATDYLTVESLAKSRARVEGSSSPPEPPLTEREIAQAGFEAALVVMIMSEDATWSTDDYAKTQSPKDRVAVWMREEKLPVELGWHAPSHSFTLAALNRISAAILVAQAGLYARNGLGSGK
ncbi:chloroperoxidase-like protein [Xylariomycetidae sp. FL2044]|nr:chloroperoxidase-like protein [Xylariomycetidae sp. FL2044]